MHTVTVEEPLISRTTAAGMKPGQYAVITETYAKEKGAVILCSYSDCIINLTNGHYWTTPPNYEVRILPAGTVIHITVKES